MTETMAMIIIIGSAILGRMGGAGLPPFHKGWRRFILPLFLGLMGCFAIGFKIELLYAVIGSVIAFCLPYGSKTPWWGKCITAICFTLPTLFLGFTIWAIIVPVLFIGLFILSNNKITANEFGWVICEILTFLGVGICWARVLGIA
jgi:hypothetical protein